MGNFEESRFLFQTKPSSSFLYIYSILKREMKTCEVDFPFPQWPGFCHVKSRFYFSGCYLNGK